MSRSLFARLARQFGPAPDPVSRREMLALSLAAGAALLTGCATPTSRAPRAPRAASNGRSVVVVGAGFAGLSCAHQLQKAGYLVTVLEARPRVGGRVLSNTKLIPGKYMESGAEFIGRNHPLWLAYAEQFGLTLVEDPDDEGGEAPLWLGGRQVSSTEAHHIYEEVDAALSRLNADARGINAFEPWLSPGAAELDARSFGDWIRNSSGASPQVQAAMAALNTSDNGVDVDKQSYLGMLSVIKGHGVERYWDETEIFRCKGGNQTLALRLADEIGRSHLHTSAPVVGVRFTDGDGGGVQVTAKNRAPLTADHLVMAVPPNTYGRITFDAALPPAPFIDQGVNVKFLARLRTPYWRELGLAPTTLSDGPGSQTWHATIGQGGTGKETDVCLSTFSGGPAAEECVRNAANVKDFYREMLERYYPGYSKQITDARFINWPADPWTEGGYSFPAPGQVMSRGALMLGAVGGRVHFAGEHTCLPFVGFMEGALQSGVRVAQRIALLDGVAAPG